MADVDVNKIIDESMTRIPARVAKILELYQCGLYLMISSFSRRSWNRIKGVHSL